MGKRYELTLQVLLCEVDEAGEAVSGVRDEEVNLSGALDDLVTLLNNNTAQTVRNMALRLVQAERREGWTE